MRISLSNIATWQRYACAIILGAIVVILGESNLLGFGIISVCYVTILLSSRFLGVGPGYVCCAMITALLIHALVILNGFEKLSHVLTVFLVVAGGVSTTLIMGKSNRIQRLAEEHAVSATRQSDRLLTTLQSIGDAVIVTDALGRIVSLNPIAEELTAWSEGAAIGRQLADVFRVIHEETREPIADPIDRVKLQNKAVALPQHSVLVARDGRERSIDDTAAPIRGATRTTDGYVLVFRDITTRRLAEKQLAGAETRFHAFMDRSPVIAFMKFADGRYVWGNAAWRAEHPEIENNGINKTDYELWPQTVAEQFRSSDQKLLESGQANEYIEKVAGKNGQDSHWLTMKFSVNSDSGERLIGGIALDVTEKMRHEELIRESEARYRLLFDSNPQPTWLIDSETTRFLAANEAAVRAYGFSNDHFLRMKLRDIQFPEDVAAIEDWISVSWYDPSSGRLSRHRKRDDTVIDVEMYCHVLQMGGRGARVVIAIDVTERMAADRALRISRERLDLVLDSALLGLWYCDLLTGALTLNERASRHFGVGHGNEATLDTYLGRIHPEDVGAIREAIDRAVGGCGPFDGEHRVVVGDLTQWIRVIGRAYSGPGGNATRFDGISIDITEQKNNETQLRLAKESAVVANNAKSKFMAMLGHELRTPLTPVLASVTEFLDNPKWKRGTDQTPNAKQEVHDLLTMIRRNVELEARLIGDLLDISRFERGQFRLELEAVDIQDVICQAIEICRDTILISGLVVKTEFEAVDSRVEGDHARLMQIVWNLVHNAAKFASVDGRLLIKTSVTTMDQDGGSSGRSALLVEFIDNGVGIERELLARVFDPFEQGGSERKISHSGLGLGLAISRSIAEAHEGTLTVTSDGKGKGATFRLKLAAIDVSDDPTLSVFSPVRKGETTSPSFRILLAEDNLDTLRYLTILLRLRGFEVESARRFSEARSLLASKPFDLLISDIQMPDGNGLELMSEFRGKVRGIALSGFGSEADERNSLEAGFASHLTKPVEISRLEATIRQILAEPKR